MIPIATTTITVLRLPVPDPDADPVDPADVEPEREEAATGVRAHFSSPTGSERLGSGTQELVDFVLDCDPTDITHLDQVRDDLTGEVFNVLWSRTRIGLGLAHTQAGVRHATGVAG